MGLLAMIWKCWLELKSCQYHHQNPPLMWNFCLVLSLKNVVDTSYLSQGIVDHVKGIARTHKSLNFLVSSKTTSLDGLFYRLILVISCGSFWNELYLHVNLVPLLCNAKQLMSLPLSISLWAHNFLVNLTTYVSTIVFQWYPPWLCSRWCLV
jgi:hypothetical protein